MLKMILNVGKFLIETGFGFSSLLPHRKCVGILQQYRPVTQ